MKADADPSPFAGAPGDRAEQPPEALEHLKAAVQAGTPWHLAVLEAIGLWTQPEEEHQGRRYKYLIGGEAFDWLALAERLCAELDGVIPAEEKERLLFSGQLPEPADPDQFRDSLGANKYRAYLNYWYGVVMEEALQLSVEEEVRKRRLALCYADSEDLVEDAFTILYGDTRAGLLDRFRKEARIPVRRRLSLADVKEFTYWVHKRRLEMWDPARVASDTKKGIRRLKRLQEETAAGQPRL